MATLTGKKISESYKDLLQVSNGNSGVDGTLRDIEDGEGTTSILQISSSSINIKDDGALQINETAVTSTAAELNLLDGVTATTAEINYLDGVTSNIQTQLDSKLSSHPSISAATSSDNSGRTYIQDITLDANGHVTGIATATETVTDTNTFRTVTAGGNTLGSSETLAFTEGSNITITESGGAVTIAATDTNTQLSNAQVRTAVEAATDSNVFTDADHTKLNNIEALADKTDTANVTTAGALMDSELTSIADVKALDQSVISGAEPTFGTANMSDATNKRFMTDAQETKLDSVESNSTADQTASDIRALGFFDTSNDGATSGLDSDKLDGEHGSHYLDFGNFAIDDDEIPIAKLASDNVSYGGVTVTLGASDATPAFDLSDATSLPIVAGTSGTLSVARGGTGATSLNDLITLGTHTTGNYVAAVAGTSNEIEVSGSAGEGATFTVGLPDDVTIGGDLSVTGDLQVNGTTTTVNQTNLDVSDNIIGLNRGISSNSNDSGLIIERGSTGDNAAIIWDETANKFKVGTTTSDASSTGNLTVATGTLIAALEGNASTATTLANARDISLTGNVVGTTSTGFDGSGAVSISTTIADDSVELGTKTTGNYVATLTAGNLIQLSNNSGEGATPTIDVDLSELNTSTSDGDGDFFAVVDSSNAQKKLTKGNINLSGFNNDSNFLTSVPNHSANLLTSGTVPLARLSGISDGNLASDAAIGNSKLANSAITIDGTSVSLGGSITTNTLSTEQVEDIVGAMFSSNTETRISATYVDNGSGNGKINLVVDDMTANTMGSGFVIEDGDSTEVIITENKEIKFVEGGGININFTNVANGTDADPFDLTFELASHSASLLGSGTVPLARLSGISDGNIASDAAIAISKLAENAITINGTSVPLGGSTTIATGSTPNNATITLSNGAGIGSIGNFTTNQSGDETLTIGVDGILQDLDTLGAPSVNGQFIVATGSGAFQYETGSTVRASLGLGDLAIKDGISDSDIDSDAAIAITKLAESAITINGTSVPLGGSTTISSPITALNSATANELVTVGSTTTELDAESSLTFDGSTLAVTGDQTLSGVLKNSSNGDNRLTLDDDSDSSVANQVTLAGVNNVNILIDGTNNGTGDFQIRSRPTTANDLDTADIIVDIDETTAIFDNITSQQFKIGGASRTVINESGLKVENASLGVGQTPPSVNGSAHISNLLRVGTAGEVALTVNDGGGNANVTFNHTSKVPDQNGNSGRIEVNVDSSGGAYMAFEVKSNVTSGVSVSTDEKLRIDDNGVDINGNILTGNSSNPTIEIRNTATSAGSGPALIFGHSQSGTSSVAKIDTHLTNGSESGRAGHLDFHTSTSSTMTHRMRIQSDGKVGIGTQSPASELHIGTGNTARHIKVSDNRAMFGYDGANAVVQGGNTKGIEFNTNSDTFNTNTRMTITAGGNVGIGTSSPAAFLDVHKDNDNSGNQFRVADTEGGSAAVRTYSTSDGTGLILNHYYAVSGSPYMRYSDFVSSMGDGAATTMRFLTKPLNSNPAVAMVIDNHQQVGIGTTSPAATIHVEDSDGSNLARFKDSDSSYAGIIIAGDTNGGHVGNSGGYAGEGIYFQDSIEVMRFYAAGSEQMRLTGTGRLGIGTASPTDTLQVEGSIGVGVGRDAQLTAVNNGLAIRNLVSDADMFFYVNDGGVDTEAMRIDGATANVGIGTTSPDAKLEITGGTATDLFSLEGAGSNFKLLAESGNSNSSNIMSYRISLDYLAGTATNGFIDFYRGSDGANGFLTFGTSGTEKMRIDGSGNVGIGETNPDSPLHFGSNVATSAGFDSFADYQILLHDTGTAATSYGMGIRGNTFMFNTDRDYEWRYENTAKLFFAGQNGRLGIGTTSPESKLNIVDSGETIIRLYASTASTRSGIWFTNGSYSYGTNIGTDNKFHITGNINSEGELVTVDASGNMGVGTTSPSSKFHVSGGDSRHSGGKLIYEAGGNSDYLRIQRASSSGRAQMQFTNESTSELWRVGLTGGGGEDFVFWNGSNNVLILDRSANEVEVSGTLLVGGTAPSGHGFNLEVLNDHAYVKGPDGWDGNGDKAIVALGSGVSNESFGCGYVYGTGLVLSTYKPSGGGHFGSSTQNSLIIADTTGQASFINDVVAFASSDIRLKENVKPLDNALDKINKINGVEFDWIDGKDEHGNSVHGNEGHDVGVIAQEIEEVLPEVVTTRDNGYKAVKYEKIVPLLIEAIKEQQQQINELKEKLNG